MSKLTWDDDGERIHLFNFPTGDESEDEFLEVAVNNFCSWHLVSGGSVIDTDELIILFMREYGANENQRPIITEIINERLG